MATMNISLPDDMKAFVDEQVRTRGYMTASEYVRDVLRRERDVEQFRSMLETTVPTPIDQFDDAFFARMRAKIDGARSR
ncbi:MAG: ribbon-helix-helix domain-containing protein [Gemmobacter sp.]